MTLRPASAIVLLALGVAACGAEVGEVAVLAPGDVEFRWDSEFNELDDGEAAIIPLDVMVFDDLTGEPLADVAVTWHAEAASFADADAVLMGDDDCDACIYDAWRDIFVEFVAADTVDGEATAAVVPLRTRTDADGLSRVYAVVDAVDADPAEGFLPVRIDVHALG